MVTTEPEDDGVGPRDVWKEKYEHQLQALR